MKKTYELRFADEINTMCPKTLYLSMKMRKSGQQHFLLFTQYFQRHFFHQNSGLFNPFPNKPCFSHVCSTSFLAGRFSKRIENTVGKGKIARNKHFFLFSQCFLPV